mgnify:CR=1 FL=1
MSLWTGNMLDLHSQVCANLPRNREQPGGVYGTLALKARYHSVCKHLRLLRYFLTLTHPNQNGEVATFG